MRSSSKHTQPIWSPEVIRNLGIVAHVDAGKTTTTERLLFHAGAITRMGEVEDGTAFTDWMSQEQERGISITAAAATFSWNGHLLHLVDTPGHVDFAMEVERSLCVVDGVVALVCAVEGVQPQTEAVWRQADQFVLPRLVFVNKCDRVGADFDAAVETIRARFGCSPVPIGLPVYRDGAFCGVCDVVSGQIHGISVGQDLLGCAEVQQDWLRARNALQDALSLHDDELLQHLMEAESAEPAMLQAALRRATLARKVVPVLAGAAKADIGVTALLDAVVAYLPSAADAANERVRATLAGNDASCVAQVFKIMGHGPQRLAFVRVFRGTLSRGQRMVESRTNREFAIGDVVALNANQTELRQSLSNGMIGAIAGAQLATGDTLYPVGAPTVLPLITVPPAVLAVAIEPDRAEDLPRLLAAVQALADEDPSLRVGTESETGRIVLYGLGELHLEIAIDRTRREFGVACAGGRPAVAYRETITASHSHREIFERVVGGRGEYAELELRLSPGPRGSGIHIVLTAAEAELPAQFHRAVLDGVREAAEVGPISGNPMTDLVVEVVSGFSTIESSNFAYKTSAFRAFQYIALNASPVVLEPVMSVEIVAPDDSIGDVLADLHTRRGKITGIAARPGVQTCACFVPMATMFGYSTDLRSRSRGRATCSIRFDHYQPISKSLRDEILRT